MNKNIILSIEGLSVSYKNKDVLTDINLQIEKGRSILLLVQMAVERLL